MALRNSTFEGEGKMESLAFSMMLGGPSVW